MLHGVKNFGLVELDSFFVPAFQRRHSSVLSLAENLNLLTRATNTTLGEKVYARRCCIDRLSWQTLSEYGREPTRPGWN